MTMPNDIIHSTLKFETILFELAKWKEGTGEKRSKAVY